MIIINNLIKKFGEHVIFNNLNLKLEANKVYAIIGASGSGKTTLLNMLGLLDNDYQGDIIIDGVLLKKLSLNKQAKFIREKINYLFQDYALIENLSVLKNLELALEYSKKSKVQKTKLIALALKSVGLENYEKKIIHTLSGGQQQRVALARAIIKPCKYILADEPTGNLDKENADNVFNLLANLTKANKTIIIVTHDYNLAQKADQIIKLK